jgi:GT2 family glycosyltransferase
VIAEEHVVLDDDTHTISEDPSAVSALAHLDDVHDPGPITQAVETVGVAPAVVAVMVTHDPGDWLEEALEALARQSYANLSVLVIDTGSAIDPTPRIASVMPGAFVRRLEHNPGYGPALNEVLNLVEGATFFLFCHDDVAPDRDAIHLLVEEAFRSNAGIVGPKLVDWDDPSILLQVGLAVDRTGGDAPYAERGELDQEQHDAVRDVFTVPGGFTLVRADLFAHLQGFDPGIDLYGEDLDLSWRAHQVGARVLVAPAARVRHREAMLERRPDLEPGRASARHRFRTMLACYGRLSLLIAVPVALVLTLVEAVLALFAGRPAEARYVVGAWVANLRHPRGIRAMRARVHAVREVPDRDVHDLQVRSFSRLVALYQGRSSRAERLTEAARRRGAERQARRGELTLYAVVAVVVVLLFGTRDLIFGSLPAVGEFTRFPSGPGTLLSAFGRSWRDSGLGSASPAATGIGALGAAGVVFGGAMGALRRVLIVGMLPIGVWGAWRLAKPLGSRRAQLASLVVYAAIPVPYNALAQGRWGGLVVYAAAPWLLGTLARSMGVAPFAVPRRGPDEVPGDPAPGRPWWGHAAALALGLALVGLLVPFILVVAVIVAVALVLGTLLTFRVAGIGRLAAVTAVGVVLAALLHIPWTFSFLHSGAQWTVFAGARSGVGGWLSLGNLLRFESGPFGAPPLGFAFLIAAGLPLLIGRGWRFDWALRAWSCALVCWGILWVGQEGWLHIALPPAEVLLAPAAAALALAVACGMAAFEVDLPGYRFGWRQVASLVAAIAVFAGALPMLGGSFGGRWRVPQGDLGQALPFIQSARATDNFKTLWVGDPEVIPASGWRLDDQVSYATSNQGLPRVEDLWPTASPQSSARLASALNLARSGDTTRLGQLLAPMGVRYLVVPDQLVPVPFSAVRHPAPASLKESLAEQLDLELQPSVNPAVTVYLNKAWRPQPQLRSAGTASGSSIVSELSPGAAAGTSVLGGAQPPTNTSGALPSGGVLATGQPANGSWNLHVNGRSVPRVTLDGWEQGFRVPSGGHAEMTNTNSLLRWALLLLELAIFVGVLVLWRRGLGRAPDLAFTDGGPVEPDEGTTVVAGGPHGGDAVAAPIVVAEPDVYEAFEHFSADPDPEPEPGPDDLPIDFGPDGEDESRPEAESGMDAEPGSRTEPEEPS